MKKILKSVFAAALAALMVFSSLSAFAAQEKESLIWYIYNEKYTFKYAGELKEGTNEITVDGERIYFDFNAEKQGYYLVSYPIEYINDFYFPDNYENGIAYRTADCGYLTYGEIVEVLYYLEAGAHFAGIEGYNTDTVTEEIEIKYCGEIAEIRFEGGEEYPLLPGYNIVESDYYDYPGYVYEVDACDSEIVFDSGEALTGRSYYVCSSETEITDGDNEMTVHFLGQEIKKSVSVYGITHHVEKIELENAEDYLTVCEYYDGTYSDSLYGLEMTLYYTDGYKETSTVKGDWMGIDLLDGNPYYINLYHYYDYDGENVYLVIEMADHEYVRLACETRPATENENAEHANEVNGETFSDFLNRCGWYFEDIKYADNHADRMRAFGQWISYFNNNIFFVLADMLENFFVMLKYIAL